MSGYNSPVDFRIPQSVPPDTPAAMFTTIQTIYNCLNQIINTLFQYCGIAQRTSDQWAILAGSPTTLLSGNLRRFYVTASETIAAGAIVSLFASGGKLQVRNANATNGTKWADGFCPLGIASGAIGEVFLTTGVLTKTAAFVQGQRYWLATSNGNLTIIPPAGAGNIEQYIGIAIDANNLAVDIKYPVQH